MRCVIYNDDDTVLAEATAPAETMLDGVSVFSDLRAIARAALLDIERNATNVPWLKPAHVKHEELKLAGMTDDELKQREKVAKQTLRTVSRTTTGRALYASKLRHQLTLIQAERERRTVPTFNSVRTRGAGRR